MIARNLKRFNHLDSRFGDPRQRLWSLTVFAEGLYRHTQLQNVSMEGAAPGAARPRLCAGCATTVTCSKIEYNELDEFEAKKLLGWGYRSGCRFVRILGSE